MNKKTDWKVIWKKEAEEDWERIKQADPSAAKEIKREIDRHLATNPKENGTKMKKGEFKIKDCYRYKVGKYRVIYKLKEKELLILVVMVDERKYRQDDDVYERKLPRITSKDWITNKRPQARDLKRKVGKE